MRSWSFVGNIMSNLRILNTGCLIVRGSLKRNPDFNNESTYTTEVVYGRSKMADSEVITDFKKCGQNPQNVSARR